MSELISTLDDELAFQYFFIVSQQNGLVLDISTGKKGGDLVLSEAHGESSQLWRYDEDCRLVSKLGLVADIEGKSKKAGAVCHAWNAHDGLNQKWRFEDEAIKSNLNNLVIDAVTLPISVHEVNNTSAQKWHFVPENEWPDGRLTVPTAQYFFIVSKDNGSVLEISTGKKGGNFVLSEARGESSQLWRWDEDCRLVSKLGLVADIKGKSKKAGAVCHAWNAHDGLNQKWRVEEGAIKSNLNGLVIDTTKKPVSMHEVKGTPTQKWYFVPEHAWDDFKLVQADPNPLNKAQFWKTLADNYLDVIIGYNIDSYEVKVHKAFKIMDECASKLEKVAKDTGIARTVGGSAQIVGGGLAIAGLVLAPVSGGVSLGLTIAGITTGVTGAVTSSGSSLVNFVWDKKKKKKITKATAPLFRSTLSLQGFLNEYINILNEAAEFLKTPKGEAVAKDAFADLKLAKEAGFAAWNSYRVGDTIYRGVKFKSLKQAKRIKTLVTLIRADYYVVNEARVALATQAAAPGVRIFGKTIVAAGTTGARALSGSMAAFGIAFGIWDVAGGAKKIAKGSELAVEFRDSSKHLKAESAKLIKLYKKLQQGGTEN